MKKTFKSTLTFIMAASLAMPTAAAASDSWNIDAEKYDEEITSHAAELGNETDRFNFCNGYYKIYDEDGKGSYVMTIQEDDPNYIEFYKNCSNIVAANNPLGAFSDTVKRDLSLGISSLAVLSHNGVISPSDIQSGRNNLIDITIGNDVMSSLVSYQAQKVSTDFNLYTNWAFANYTDKERADKLIEDAENAQNDGKYFLVIMRRNNNYNNNNSYQYLTGIGMLEGEFECDGDTYDKCVILYDSEDFDLSSDDNTQEPASSRSSLFINSETGKIYFPKCEGKFLSIYDDDFINFNGRFNPSSEYKTDLTDINYVEVMGRKSRNLTVTRRDGTEYEALTVNGDADSYYGKGVFFCDGSKLRTKNSDGSDLFMVNYTNTKSYIESKFIGTVDDIEKDDTHFSFDTDAVSEHQYDATKYYLKFILEEGSYSFTPHFSYEFVGETDSDFSSEITDRGIILSGSKGVRCTFRTKDVKRDEDGNLISAEDNEQTDAIDTAGSVMVAFGEDNKLKYYIGENYDIEVQKGDINCDGVIDARDASGILTAYVNPTTSILDPNNYASNVLSDYDGNGIIDARDASAVLTLYTKRNN